MPHWALPAFVLPVTVLVFIACSFDIGFLKISKLQLWHQFMLFGLSLFTRFVVNDPLKYLLFRMFLRREQ